VSGSISRRRLLSLAGLSLGALGGSAFAAPKQAGTRSRFRLAQLVYEGEGTGRQSALRRLAWEIEKRTSIEVDPVAAEMRLGDPAMFRSPFIYLSGQGALPPPGEEDLGRLRRHLDLGGLLLADAACGCAGGEFERGVRALLARLYPRSSLAPLPADHVIWKSFYLLSGAPGRVLVSPPQVLVRDQRVVALLSSNDLGGAWARDSFGRWEHDVSPGGQGQREQAFRFGINLVMYALCLDYKDDQVHVPFILKRRRWRTE
jgi:hypothetical protein